MDTSSAPDARYGRVAARFDVVLCEVAPSQWESATPCEGWSVRDLVVHVIETHQRVLGIVRPDAPKEAVEGDLIAMWRGATAAIVNALETPELATTMVAGRAGEQPYSDIVGGLLTVDTLCHTWDLSRAIGHDESLDPVAVATAHDLLRSIDANIRVPGGFAPAIEPGLDADDQTKFLNFAGRTV